MLSRKRLAHVESLKKLKQPSYILYTNRTDMRIVLAALKMGHNVRFFHNPFLK